MIKIREKGSLLPIEPYAIPVKSNNIFFKLFILFILFFSFSCTKNEVDFDLGIDFWYIWSVDNTGLNNKIEGLAEWTNNKELVDKMTFLREVSNKVDSVLFNNDFEVYENKFFTEYETILRDHALKRLNNRRYSQEDSTTIRQIFERLDYHKRKHDRMPRLNWAIDCAHLENYYLKDHRIHIYAGGTCGGGQFEYYDNFTFSDNDSVQVGKEKKVVIIPEYFNKKYEYVQYDSIRFLIDDVEKKVSYTFENFEGLGILQFIPSEVGDYKIKGNYFIATKDKSEKRIESLIHFEFKGEK